VSIIYIYLMRSPTKGVEGVVRSVKVEGWVLVSRGMGCLRYFNLMEFQF
jgi:hypothetical protein